MPEFNKEWGHCIKAMMDELGLSTRDVEVATEGLISRSYVNDLQHGKVPDYRLAIRILSHPIFPRQKAISCLESAGYPIPREWLEEEPELAFEYFLRTTGGTLSDFSRDFLMNVLKERLAADRESKMP